MLFWICIHCNGPGKGIGSTEFSSWNYESDLILIGSRVNVIDEEVDFLAVAKKSFTPYYQPLIPWVNRLRREVFPDGRRWRTLEPKLYSSMREVLREAQEDPNV